MPKTDEIQPATDAAVVIPADATAATVTGDGTGAALPVADEAAAVDEREVVKPPVRLAPDSALGL